MTNVKPQPLGADAPIHLYPVDMDADGTRYLQSQLFVGRMTRDFMFEKGKMYTLTQTGWREFKGKYKVITQNTIQD